MPGALGRRRLLAQPRGGKLVGSARRGFLQATRGLRPEGSPWGRRLHALAWAAPRSEPWRVGEEVQQRDPLPGPGTVRGTRPRACAASAVPGTGVLLCFLKTGTSLLECIGFSEDSLELQHVGASERCPGLAARRRSPHAASVLEFSKRVPSLGLEDVGSRGAHRVPYLSAPLWG